MTVSVVIITKNQKQYLEKTIPILLQQNFFGKLEVIVVDSGSEDGALEYIKSQQVTLIELKENKFIYARAFNAGAAKAHGDIIIRLSGDAIPQRNDFVYQMVKPFTSPKIGGTYGKYTVSQKKGYEYPNYWSAERFDKPLTTFSISPPIWAGIDMLGIKLGEKKMKIMDEVFSFAGGCCAIRKTIWEKRKFNEQLMAAEDGEYAWFLHLAGYDIVYNPQALVLHEHTPEQNKKVNHLSFWQIILVWQFVKYWSLKSIGIDQFENLKLHA